MFFASPLGRLERLKTSLLCSGLGQLLESGQHGGPYAPLSRIQRYTRLYFTYLININNIDTRQSESERTRRQ